MAFQQYINDSLNNFFVAVSNQIPEKFQPLVVLGLYTFLIIIYAIFIWKFYKLLSKRNLMGFNLNKYNRTEHPVLYKLIASGFFLLEYVIIIPIFVFFWFSVLSLFLLLISNSQSVQEILLISAAVVAATRVTSYYSSELSKEMAKLFPFTVLAIFLLDVSPNFIETFVSRFSEIPSLLGNIFVYLIFIIILEVVFRGLFTIIDLVYSSNSTEAGR